jgi:metal-responsive CopG/Arc/MetJ family transcriptional regulator
VRNIDSATGASHTYGMKVAISLPDDVFAEGEALARALNTTRSQLYARALREFASRHNPDGLTEAVNAALAEAGEERSDFSRAAARRAFAATEW